MGQNFAYGDPSHQARGQGTTPGHDELQKSHPSKHKFPILALAPFQFRVIDTLDSLGWRKYAVHIQQVAHSHAAIIVSHSKSPATQKGTMFFRHWLDKEFHAFSNTADNDVLSETVWFAESSCNFKATLKNFSKRKRKLE